MKNEPLTFSTSNEFQIFFSLSSALPGDVIQRIGGRHTRNKGRGKKKVLEEQCFQGMYRKMCHFVEVHTVVFYLSPGQLGLLDVLIFPIAKCKFIFRREVVAYWWEHSPSYAYVGWICWFSSLLCSEWFFLGFKVFPSPKKPTDDKFELY